MIYNEEFDISNGNEEITDENNYGIEIVETKVLKKNKKSVTKILCCILVSGVCGGVFGATASVVDSIISDRRVDISHDAAVEEVVIANVNSTNTSQIEGGVTEIIEKTMPSIVSITSLSVQEVMSFFGGINSYESESAGSGIIIGKNDTELLVLTNNHVVEGSTNLTVTFDDGVSLEAAVKGGNSGEDIAVIAIQLDGINEETMSGIKIAALGDSNLLKAGEQVIAIGNALGYGQSVTTGVVSALERSIDGIEGTLIQTDAAINPGNSGGALLNSNGEVIGINTAKVSQNTVEGMGYAIPITDAMETIQKLMNRETKTIVEEAKRGYLGIQGVTVTEESSAMYNMPAGVYIVEVMGSSACEISGIFKGSIITAIDGSSVQNMEDLQEELSYCAIGDKIRVELQIPNAQGEYAQEEVEVMLQSRDK